MLTPQKIKSPSDITSDDMATYPKPVLIGSSAYAHYFPPYNARDVDMIVNKEMLEKYDTDVFKTFFETPIDIVSDGDKYSDKLIVKFCNSNMIHCKIITVENKNKVRLTYLVPPLELLYVIYKSHIHRIVPATGIQGKDIEIWSSTLVKYNHMRNRIGYTILDQMIYHPKLGDLKNYNCMPIYTEENRIRKSLVMIYTYKFKETNWRIGDTELDIEKTEEEFFDDAVPRLLPHDELHKRVAQWNRNTKNLLFTKFQVDGKVNVSMDRVLFNDGDETDKRNCVFEEIVVLYLERKFLLEMNQQKKHGKYLQYADFDKNQMHKDIVETFAHFATNLCGMGHHWLRRWVLDHYMYFINNDMYNAKKIHQLATDIVWTKSELDEWYRKNCADNPEKWIELYKKFKYNIKCVKINSYCGDEKVDKFTYPLKRCIEDMKNHVEGQVVAHCSDDETNNIEYTYSIGNSKKNNKHVYEVDKFFLNLGVKSKTITETDRCITICLYGKTDYLEDIGFGRIGPMMGYDYQGDTVLIDGKGIGVYLTRSGGIDDIILFLCKMTYISTEKGGYKYFNNLDDSSWMEYNGSDNESKTVSWEFSTLGLSDRCKQVTNTRSCVVTDYFIHYYKSVDDSCGWRNPHEETSASYISHYGSAPEYLRDFIDVISVAIVK